MSVDVNIYAKRVVVTLSTFWWLVMLGAAVACIGLYITGDTTKAIFWLLVSAGAQHRTERSEKTLKELDRESDALQSLDG